MPTNDGYILLSRSLIDSEVFQNDKWLRVWIWCLLKANHKTKKVSAKKGKGTAVITLKRGQFLFGRQSASKALKMPQSTIRNIISKLKSCGNLEIQKDSSYSIITISNYNKYQDYQNYKRTVEGQAKSAKKDSCGTGQKDRLYERQNEEIRTGQEDSSTEKEKDTDNEVKNKQIKDIVRYLNEQLKTRYKTSSEKTRKHINARLTEGFTLEDFKIVIDKKAMQWKDDKEMSKYLRPETLFGTKFESYLNEKTTDNRSWQYE